MQRPRPIIFTNCRSPRNSARGCLQREVLVQEIQRIRLSPHHRGLAESGREQDQSGCPVGRGRWQVSHSGHRASASWMRSAAKDLPYAATFLKFDPQGRRVFSCWDQDQVIASGTARPTKSELWLSRATARSRSGRWNRPCSSPKSARTIEPWSCTICARESAAAVPSPPSERPDSPHSTITPNGSHVAAIWSVAGYNPEEEPAENDPTGAHCGLGGRIG